MMTTLSDIEEGFREITEAQSRVTLAKQGEGTNSAQRIRENMQFIQQTMKQNKELINKLKQQVREGSVKSEQLKKIIDNLTEQMEEKDRQIQSLREELDKKDIHIAELDERVADLNSNVENLTEETNQKSQTIDQQDKQLNTGWFVFGTKKELKEQNILADGEVLRSNFNKEYFTKIDIRIDKEIKLYSKSAKMLTSHPSSSYTLQRDANKQYVLRITDPQLFWSTSKYLVILVK
jgi:chromosome segregation ATPase